jgi:3-keto-5-aminohexanoate cleavage enzyme
MSTYHKGFDSGRMLGVTPEEEIARALQMHPIEFEERISTIDRPLILENAYPGWQPRLWGPRSLYPSEPIGFKEGGVRYNAVPTSQEEQIAVHLEAIRCGTACIHLHPRDSNPAASPLFAPEAVAPIFDKILEKEDAITLQHTWTVKENNNIDYVSEGEAFLKLAGGNRYVQGAVVLWPPADAYNPNYTKEVQRGVQFMLENKIKPIHKLRSQYAVRKLKRLLIDTGIEPPPYVLIHDMGHPFGWPMDQDPWTPIDIVSNLMQTKQRIPDSVIGVYSGGRNWLPITYTAILTGADIVRVGIEDMYWMYPHRDTIVSSNIETVRKVTDFAQLIGRDIADVATARKILDIERTS